MRPSVAAWGRRERRLAVVWAHNHVGNRKGIIIHLGIQCPVPKIWRSTAHSMRAAKIFALPIFDHVIFNPRIVAAFTPCFSRERSPVSTNDAAALRPTRRSAWGGSLRAHAIARFAGT